MSDTEKQMSVEAWAIKDEDGSILVDLIRRTEDDAIESAVERFFVRFTSWEDSKRQALEDCDYRVVRVRIMEIEEGSKCD